MIKSTSALYLGTSYLVQVIATPTETAGNAFRCQEYGPAGFGGFGGSVAIGRVKAVGYTGVGDTFDYSFSG